MKVAIAVLSVMLVMAMLCVCLGYGDRYDFFYGFDSFISPLTEAVDGLTRVYNEVFGKGYFEDDDKVIITRFYYTNSVTGRDEYADLVLPSRISIKNTNELFYYSTDSKAYRYYMGFVLDKNGDIISSGAISRYKLRTGFGDYIEKYQKNPSTDGWNR